MIVMCLGRKVIRKILKQQQDQEEIKLKCISIYVPVQKAVPTCNSRWFADGKNLITIQTTNTIAVDLNSLLYNSGTGDIKPNK